jgi:beta-lactamase regulating signal transducer with metallopeptidase domain
MSGLLLTLLAQGTIVGGAALLANVALRRYPPHLRMAVLTVGVFSFLVPFGRLGSVDVIFVGGPAGSSFLSILNILWLITGCGAAWAAARLALEAWALRRLLARSEPDVTLHRRAKDLARDSSRRVPDVRVSDDCRVPFVVSFRTPVIVIPRSLQQLQPERLDAVLLHEIAHVRGGDVVTSALLAVFSALLWFHPVAGLLVRAMRQALEERCDDFVLRRSPGGAFAYAETLVGIVASLRAHAPAAALSMASGETRSLASRLRRIAGHDRLVTATWRSRVMFVAIAAPLLAGATVLAPRFVSPATPTEQLRSTGDGESVHAFRHSHRHSHH